MSTYSWCVAVQWLIMVVAVFSHFNCVKFPDSGVLLLVKQLISSVMTSEEVAGRFSGHMRIS